MFDFEKYHPDVVRFESRHLTRAAHESAVRRLVDRGYVVAVDGADTIGWRDARPEPEAGWSPQHFPEQTERPAYESLAGAR
jgi:hypothetical protein